MTPERWRAIENLFDQVADRPETERAAILARADSGLRHEVEKLLSSAGLGRTMLDGAIADAESLIGVDPALRFGAYRVTGTIGHGGMGAVYSAVRDDLAFEKRVAIKVVQVGSETPEALSSFRQERQILAKLDHPNIARLIDGGETPAGVPYIVLEYVEGERITAYCDARKLNVQEKLKLFLKVCEGVDYAHRNLIVHRDLKPANILVSADGTPKLLDFGIAKLVDAEPGRTMTMFQALTPHYASPEQVRGQTITTATDVYSLGVVLYEMLTGRLPYEIPTLTPTEIERTVCAVNPKPAGVSEDLDNILAVALRKEPERRYPSVRQFAEDVDRVLNDLPVKARPDTLLYRARKFVRRNSLSLTAASLVIVALTAGIVSSLHSANQARRRFDQVRNLANTFLFEFDDSIRDIPGTTASRELIVRTALRYLDSLAAEAGSDLDLKLELATAYEKVGDVQGSPGAPSLGKHAEALESYSKARRLLAEILARRPSQVSALRAQAATSMKAVDLYLLFHRTAEAQEGIAAAHRAVEAARAAGAQDGTLEFLDGGAWFREGAAKRNTDPEQAAQSFGRALASFTGAQALQPADRFQNAIAVTRGQLGHLRLTRGDPAGAAGHFRAVISLREELLARNPSNQGHLRGVANTLSDLGDAAGLPSYFNLGDPEGAERFYQRSKEIYLKLLRADPKNAVARTDLIFLLNRLAALRLPDKPSEAKTLLTEGLTYANEMGDAAKRPDIQTALGVLHERLALAALAEHQYQIGLREIDAAIQILIDCKDDVLSIAEARKIKGDLLLANGQRDEARRTWLSAQSDAGLPDLARTPATDLRSLTDLYERIAGVSDSRCEWDRKALPLWQELSHRKVQPKVVDPQIAKLSMKVTDCPTQKK